MPQPTTLLLCILQYLSLELMNRGQRLKQRRQEVLRDFERFPGDTGSTEVQGVLPAGCRSAAAPRQPTSGAAGQASHGCTFTKAGAAVIFGLLTTHSCCCSGAADAEDCRHG